MHPADFASRLIVVVVLFIAPAIAGSATSDDVGSSPSKTVPIAECAINGFRLGDTPEMMRRQFGEPDMQSSTANMLVVHRYDGLQIEFSSGGRGAMGFHVSSPAYRLKSGVGVDSTWAEVVAAYGPGKLLAWGDGSAYVYRIVDSEGKRIPATLTFRIVDKVVAEFLVSTIT